MEVECFWTTMRPRQREGTQGDRSGEQLLWAELGIDSVCTCNLILAHKIDCQRRLKTDPFWSV